MDQDAINNLSSGDIIVIDGKLFVGLERYRHSGDVYARCQAGNFCDREWDVSPIVGWVSPNISTIGEEWIDEFLAGKPDNILKYFDSEIQMLNDAVSGNCWGYNMILYDADGDQLDDDSCWGCLGDSDYCMEEAKDAADFAAEHMAEAIRKALVEEKAMEAKRKEYLEEGL